MDFTNETYTDDEYKELENIDLPPLSPVGYLQPHSSTLNNTLSPLAEENDYYEIYTSEEPIVTNSIAIVSTGDEESDNGESELPKDEIKKEDNLQEEFYHTCCYCQKYLSMREMFSLECNKANSLDRLICLSCSVKSEESYMLHDWTIETESDEKRLCPRCRKEKPNYKFTNCNKYCDYCLIRKKYLRLKNKKERKEMYGEESGSGSGSGSGSDDNSDKVYVKKVKCCCCNRMVKMKETFLYTKVKNPLCDRHVCLSCSLDINNCHLLCDWEDNVSPSCGKMCTRCKKIKSFSRFKVGHLGCEYCCLKRKRQYLLTRK